MNSGKNVTKDIIIKYLKEHASPKLNYYFIKMCCEYPSIGIDFRLSTSYLYIVGADDKEVFEWQELHDKIYMEA